MSVKDYILKKCSWFYEFKDIFHKHPNINPPLIIDSSEPLKCDEAAVDEDDLGSYDFDLDQDLEDSCQMTTREIEREEDIGVSFSNLSDLGSNSNSSQHSTLSQIAQDARRKSCKKANMKILREVEGENSNLAILSDDEEENEDIIPTQAHTSNFTRPSYFQAKSQQASTNTNSEQSITPILLILSKPVVQNRNSSPSSKNCISKRKHHSDSDQLLDYVEDTQGS